MDGSNRAMLAVDLRRSFLILPGHKNLLDRTTDLAKRYPPLLCAIVLQSLFEISVGLCAGLYVAELHWFFAWQVLLDHKSLSPRSKLPVAATPAGFYLNPL